MNDFYLTLPSNVTTDIRNTTSNFSVYLPNKLELQGKWEVALAEIQYPFTWNNIHGPLYEFRDNWIDVTFINGYLTTIFVPVGYYGTVEKLLKAIKYGQENASKSLSKTIRGRHSEAKRVTNDTGPDTDKEDVLLKRHIKDIKDGFGFMFDQTLNRVRFRMYPNKIRAVEISERLQYMLGFQQPKIIRSKALGKYMPDLRGGFYSLHVYCSLVEPQIVGNVTVPLLRTVHIEGKHGDIVEKLFDTPHYVPVMSKEISKVNIEIKDDSNQLVPFNFGKVVVKLHFRRKRTVL